MKAGKWAILQGFWNAEDNKPETNRPDAGYPRNASIVMSATKQFSGLIYIGVLYQCAGQ